MKTLTRLGYAVSFKTPEGREFGVRGSMLHDPSGDAWPKCSLLIAPFARGGGGRADPRSVPKFARRWFGKDYEPSEGTIPLPPRELDPWGQGVVVEWIGYTRTVTDEELQHPFGRMGGILSRIIPLRFAGALPTLYRRSGMARLEMKGCSITPAGIVAP